MKIPEYQRSQDINATPLPQANPEALTADTKAMGQFGEQGMNLGASLIREQAYENKKLEAATLEITKRENKFAALDAFRQSSAEKQTLLTEYEKKLDGVNNSEKFTELSKKFSEIDQKHTSNNSNPYFLEHYTPLAQSHNIQYETAFARTAAITLDAKEKAQVTGLVDDTIRNANFMNVDVSLNTLNQIIDTSGISPAVKEQAKREGQFKLMDTVTRQAIQDPVTSPAFIKMMQDDKTQKAWMDKVDPNRIDEYKNMINKAVNAKSEDDAYGFVFQKFGLNTSAGDYEAAIRELRNPASETPAIKLLNTTQRHNIEVMVKGQEAYNTQEAARLFTEGKKRDLDLAGETFIKGDVAGAIRITRESSFIQGMDKVHIIDSFQKPAPEGKSNSNTYLEGAEKMYDTFVPLEDKKVWLLKNRGNLNISDFKHLSNVGMSTERSNDKAATKSGIDTLKAALITPGFTSQTQKERLDRAIKLYESGTTEYKDSLNTPEKIKAYANTVLKMPEFTSLNPIADMKADMKKIRGVGLSGTPPVTAPVKAKTVTIDGKQYKDGDIITQKDGTKGIVRIK